MKTPFIAAILSAALTLSACSAQETTQSPQTEATSTAPAAEIPNSVTTTVSTTASAPATTSNTDFQDTKTPTQTEAATTPKKEFPGDIEIPVTYQHAENKKGKPCRSVADELGYEDFPAKEDIEPAIQCAFDAYFSKTKVYANYESEGTPCTIENLSFSSGLYLDFNGDGEKESLIVVKKDSDTPFTSDSIAVYYRNESDNVVFTGDKLAHGSNSISHLYALVYDDCIDIIAEEFFGASGQASEVYSYNNGFKKEISMGKGSVIPLDTYLGCFGWYDSLGGFPPAYYIRTDNGYSRVGAEEIGLDVLFERIPEIRTFTEMIEDYYGEEVISVKTEGYLNFFFFIKGSYICAYINNDTLYSNFNDIPNKYFNEKIYWEDETEYGLCLL